MKNSIRVCVLALAAATVGEIRDLRGQGVEIPEGADHSITRAVMSLHRNVVGSNVEAALTDEQIEKLDELRAEYSRRWSSQPRFGDNEEFRAELFQWVQQEMDEFLLPFQVRALRSMAAQRIVISETRRVNRLPSLVESRFARQLIQLTPHQIRRADRIREESAETLADVVETEFETFKASRVEQTRRQIDEILTATQTEQLRDILGEPLNFEDHPEDFDIRSVQSRRRGKVANALAWFRERTDEQEPFAFYTLTDQRIQPLQIEALITDPIIDELELSEEQAEQIAAIRDEVRYRMENSWVPREEFEEAAREIDRFRLQAIVDFREVLLAHQVERLRQLAIQWWLLRYDMEFPVLAGEVRQVLGLRSDQIQEIEDRLSELNADLTQILLRVDQRRTDIGRQADQQLLEILTPKQRRIVHQYFDRRQLD